MIVTKERIQVFGNIIDDQFIPSEFGDQVTSLLSKFSTFHPEVIVELFQVMPNHVHLLLHVAESDNRVLGQTISAFKSFTNRLYRGWLGADLNSGVNIRLWQRGYFDHIVRSDVDLQETWSYIESNPMNWTKDDENSK